MNVVDLIHHTPSDQLRGHFRVEQVGDRQIKLIGWALGTAARVTQVEIVSNGRVIARVAPDRPRPDIAEKFPTTPAAAACGFETTVEALGDGGSRLQIRAVLDDGSQAPLGELRVVIPRRRRWTDVFRPRK